MATETEPVEAVPPGNRHRRRWLVLTIGLAVVAVAAVLAFAVFEVQTLFIDDEADEAGPTFESGAVLDETGDGSQDPQGTNGDDRIGANGAEGVTVTKVATGRFKGREHDGKGTVTLLTDGRQTFVRFEDDFATSNGPELWAVVYVDGERIELEPLKGNEGSQNYELPGEIDPESVDRVAVWCKRFDVTFTDAKVR